MNPHMRYNRAIDRMKGLRLVRATKTSGANGYPSRWYVWEINDNGHPLLRKDGRPRQWSTREAAHKARRKLQLERGA